MKIVREVHDDTTIVCSQDLADLPCLREFADEDREHFVVLGLSVRNKVLFREVVAIGSLSDCHVEPREIFKRAIINSSYRIVLVHNHPSGDPRPSPHDIALTRRLSKGGELLGIPVLDHIVLGASGAYASLRDLGMIG